MNTSYRLGSLPRPCWIRFRKPHYAATARIVEEQVEFLVASYNPKTDEIALIGCGPEGSQQLGAWWPLMGLLKAEAEWNETPSRGGSPWCRIGYLINCGQLQPDGTWRPDR